MRRALLAALFLCALSAAACAEKRVALVIGNSNYAYADKLDNPKNDASDIAAALKRLSFEVTTGVDLTVAQFDKAVDDFTITAKDADVALFFFSGHGLQIDKRGYLAPVNAKTESESGALRELVPIQEVVARIENAAKVSVIVLDACRDNELQERLRRIAIEKNRAVVPPKGLPPLSVVGSNTLIVYATVPGETASDGKGRNSPFTGALLKHIETPGLEIELLFKNVTADVLKTTGGKQQPERLSRLQSVVFLASQTGGVSKPQLSEPQPPLTEAARAWADIKESKEAAVFEAFRKEYGPMSKLYDTLAAQRIAELGQPPEPGKLKDQVAAVAPPRPASAAPKLAEDACADGLLVSVAQSKTPPCIKPGSGESFRDCADCPEMVAIPAGSFVMGSPDSEPERESFQKGSESPQHRVTMAKPFAVGKFAVTFAEWDACEADGGCGGYIPQDQGWGRADRPVINVSWDDAQAYVKWLSKKTGKTYRLLSEAEFEYAARAGTTTPFWWGSSITPEQANYDGSAEPYKGGGKKGEYRQKTLPVKSFKPNPWGLYQVHGNVWTWTQDCWVDSYNDAPKDGTARSTGNCSVRAVRGGSWNYGPLFLRAAYRSWVVTTDRFGNVGFRLARTL